MDGNMEVCVDLITHKKFKKLKKKELYMKLSRGGLRGYHLED